MLEAEVVVVVAEEEEHLDSVILALEVLVVMTLRVWEVRGRL